MTFSHESVLPQHFVLIHFMYEIFPHLYMILSSLSILNFIYHFICYHEVLPHLYNQHSPFARTPVNMLDSKGLCRGMCGTSLLNLLHFENQHFSPIICFCVTKQESKKLHSTSQDLIFFKNFRVCSLAGCVLEIN